MEIRAAAYGCERLIFLADSVSCDDEKGLAEYVSGGGSFHVSEQISGIENSVRLTLMPYMNRLENPKFITGEVVGEDLIRKVLMEYDILVIEAIDEDSMIDYNERFSDLERRPPIRVQPEQHQQASAEIGRSWVH
ncbi:hypothetical protein GOV12_05685 [Candidatus Pacearchaeota archaeon]|nr:hypothetical protein [Candidatus Pacearchaeota archaeon]